MLNRDYIKVVYIDLTTRRIRIERRQDLMEYIGGSGVATASPDFTFWLMRRSRSSR